MSEKRRDNKNRILRTGESQRKDGRYAYKYIDTFGKPQFVYSWKLVPTDKTPQENVKLSDAKEWALRMKEKGYGLKTINNHKRFLKAAFYTAIQDDCIRKNPFDFQLNTVLEDDTEPKEPLSPAQEAAFLSFVQHDKVYQKYYDEIVILLGPGLRISELCTTLANAGMNPKALQYIMGHSNINMTLNYYAHTTSETLITEMKRLIA